MEQDDEWAVADRRYFSAESMRQLTQPVVPTTADSQDLHGHTRPETTMIYAPPELEKHFAALERLRRSDATCTPFPAGRPVLAGSAGRQDSA